MKQVKIKKLSLNKSTIAKLNDDQLKTLNGGGPTTIATNTGTCVNCGASNIAACKTKLCSGASGC